MPLIVAECQSASVFGVACEGGRPGPRFRFERGAPAIALDVHLDDSGVVNDAIDGRERPGGGMTEVYQKRLRVPIVKLFPKFRLTVSPLAYGCSSAAG
ncbi:hypothetical protein MTX26_27090 [Bradyrhizobium sp. ISRA443]|uniref:hypothetical protein n=1 Tax=unclassified Bradyrhizobium TaxID=2631580 RepID=UPI00247A3A56|nr:MULTISPECIES: hypothetical protein [unclassified Bradyrhizobium]WGR96309.1 hypothetical protein MTX20_01905 [Bradyrhizobium sp. ISRA435]WGS02951.1 hypothetical protein MTX23_27085 [Bradyrhizobium sp. ISRA436]WGS09838.1 hypothetical protein MTX18_27095 [Bradyrhizobium sp. ISRA437]WGS16724.1 hypothetical protein MTX26_27090 [Bradyrhizobium sp. ISRA443]